AAVAPLPVSGLAPLSAPTAALAAAPAALAAHAAAAAPDLPAAAAAPAAGAAASLEAPRGVRAAAEPGKAGPASPEAAEGAWSDAGRLFDNLLGETRPAAAGAPAAPAVAAAPLSAWSARTARSPQAAAYARAVRAASDAGWTGRGGPVLDAAEALLAASGVEFSREESSLRIAPERGRSPLNDFAYDVSRALGASVAYVPERTRDAAAAFNGRQRLLMVANFDRPDFFLAAVHEARHARYSALLRRGDIRLFHLQAVARPGRSVAPNAEVYSRYLSLEELSTFPKTLKHMITEQEKLQGGAAGYLAERTAVRARQFLDIMRSAAYLADQIESLDRRGGLRPRRLKPAEAAALDLEPAQGIDYFALELPQATLYVPVLRRETRRFGFKVARSSGVEARAALRLRAKLIGDLALASVPSAKAYLAADRDGDRAAAGRAADRLIAAARAAESAWPADATAAGGGRNPVRSPD
ncbi:MAG TPA: hypothetical protein VH309_09700, partial [Elusimicrobiota bacterium]|nr:hypothetical protein [Elusimicrobiota bacterium]